MQGFLCTYSWGQCTVNFPQATFTQKSPRHKVCAFEGSSRLTLTSTTLLTRAPCEYCCSRQKTHHGLRERTYHCVRNSWMWQECHVPLNGKGSDFFASQEWLNSLWDPTNCMGKDSKRERADDDRPEPSRAIWLHHPCSAHQAVRAQW